MERLSPYSYRDLDRIRQHIDDENDKDWTSDTIEFVCEEVLSLEAWRVCFVHPFMWQRPWSEATREVAIAKLCQLSRSRLTPPMFPLLEPSGGLRADFTTFLFFVHKDLPDDPSQNHWSLLVLYYDEMLFEQASNMRRIVQATFYHFDSLEHEEMAGNKKEAWRAAELITRWLLYKEPDEARFCVVEANHHSEWPRQTLDQRSCGKHACVAAYLVGAWMGLQNSACTSRPLPRECVHPASWRRAAEHLHRSTVDRLDQMMDTEGFSETLAFGAFSYLNALYDNNTVRVYTSASEFGAAITWRSPVPIQFYLPPGGLIVYVVRLHEATLYARTIEKHDSLKEVCREAGALFRFHLLDGFVSPPSTQLWIYRLIEYIVRTQATTRLLPSKRDVYTLVADMPRHAYETYGATRERIASRSGALLSCRMFAHPDCLPRTVVRRVDPLTVKLLLPDRIKLCPAQMFMDYWCSHRDAICAELKLVPWKRGVDFQAPRFSAQRDGTQGDTVCWQLRLSNWEYESLERVRQLWSKTAQRTCQLSYIEGMRKAVHDGHLSAPVWQSDEWFAAVTSYLIYRVAQIDEEFT